MIVHAACERCSRLPGHRRPTDTRLPFRSTLSAQTVLRQPPGLPIVTVTRFGNINRPARVSHQLGAPPDRPSSTKRRRPHAPWALPPHLPQFHFSSLTSNAHRSFQSSRPCHRDSRARHRSHVACAPRMGRVSQPRQPAFPRGSPTRPPPHHSIYSNSIPLRHAVRLARLRLRRMALRTRLRAARPRLDFFAPPPTPPSPWSSAPRSLFHPAPF